MMFHFYEMKSTAKWNFIAYIYKKEFPSHFKHKTYFPHLRQFQNVSRQRRDKRSRKAKIITAGILEVFRELII